MIRRPNRCASGSTTWTRSARAFALCTTLWGCLLGSGCASKGSAPGERIGDFVEAACVKGQLSLDQARAVNGLPYRTKPSYCLGETREDGTDGDVHCEAEAQDRIFAAHCARAIRALFEGR